MTRIFSLKKFGENDQNPQTGGDETTPDPDNIRLARTVWRKICAGEPFRPLEEEGLGPLVWGPPHVPTARLDHPAAPDLVRLAPGPGDPCADHPAADFLLGELERHLHTALGVASLGPAAEGWCLRLIGGMDPRELEPESRTPRWRVVRLALELVRWGFLRNPEIRRHLVDPRVRRTAEHARKTGGLHPYLHTEAILVDGAVPPEVKDAVAWKLLKDGLVFDGSHVPGVDASLVATNLLERGDPRALQAADRVMRLQPENLPEEGFSWMWRWALKQLEGPNTPESWLRAAAAKWDDAVITDPREDRPPGGNNDGHAVLALLIDRTLEFIRDGGGGSR